METRGLVEATKKGPPRNSQFVSSGLRHGPTLSGWSKNTTESGVAAGAPSATSPLWTRMIVQERTLRFIAAKRGGTVDGYPIAIPQGKKYSSSFIWGGTESMYIDLGFRPLGSFGTSNRVMVMRKVVRSR